MGKNLNEYDANGALTTTIQVDPVQTAPRSNFFDDLARIRALFQQPQQQPVIPAPRRDTPPGKGMNVPPLPVQHTMAAQAQALAAPQPPRERRSVYTRIAGGPNAISGRVRADKYDPGAQWSGYED